MPIREQMKVLGLLALALFSGGCSNFRKDKIHHEVDPAQQPTARCQLEDHAEPADRILGIGISGGGSRAAVFGAAALEALAEHGVLGQVSHLSSVSGGSLPAAYYLTHPPDCEDTATECWHEYFSELKGRMRHRFGSWALWRNSRPSRFSSPTRRVISLQEVLDKQFLNNKTFGDLESHPVLLLNATSYDETRRFVFSNVCLAEGAVDSSGSSKRYRIMAEKALAQRALQAFTFSRPQCLRPVPSDLPVSLGVATSAAFPGALGPVSIQAPSACDGDEPEWWHLGDGGIIENQGIDSLEEVLLRRLADDGPPLEKALILSLDAGAHADPEKLKRESNFEMNLDPAKLGLVVESTLVRGQAYHDIFWDELLDELAKEGIGYEKITFQYGLAELDERPASCNGKKFREKTIHDLLLEIETKFSIPECHADLLEMAAHQLVHKTLDDETARRLTSEGFSIHTGADCALAP
jgi:hypothetical protein